MLCCALYSVLRARLSRMSVIAPSMLHVVQQEVRRYDPVVSKTSGTAEPTTPLHRTSVLVQADDHDIRYENYAWYKPPSRSRFLKSVTRF